MLRSFRIGGWRKPAGIPAIEPECVEFQPPPTLIYTETSTREILLASRDAHSVQSSANSSETAKSAVGFPLDLYKELFETGAAGNATFTHVCEITRTGLDLYKELFETGAARNATFTRVCETGDAAPLLIYSAPRERCESASLSRRATNRPTS